MIEDFRSAVFKCSMKYSNVVLLCADDFYDADYSKSFSSRQVNLGSSVANLVASAVGFAARGKLPLVLFKSGEVLGAMEQIQKLIVEPNLNVKLIGFGGNESLGLFEAVEGLKVDFPEDSDAVVSVINEMMNTYGPAYLNVSI